MIHSRRSCGYGPPSTSRVSGSSSTTRAGSSLSQTVPNRGLGLLLTEQLSSELDITTSERGTRVALEKALPRATM